MLKKSFAFRVVVMCALGMLPLLGYVDNVSAADVGTIKGKVTGQRSDASMSGVSVEVLDESGKMVGSTVSEKSGRFTLARIPVGTYDVKAGKAVAKSVQVTMSQPVTQVDFQVPEKGYLVFSGMSTTTKIIIGAIAAIGAGVGIYAAVDSDSSSNRVASP